MPGIFIRLSTDSAKMNAPEVNASKSSIVACHGGKLTKENAYNNLQWLKIFLTFGVST